MEIDALTATRIDLLRLAFDTGALVLIWLVQLVIYPVFSRLPARDFKSWHPVYTRRVTLVVMPIMLGQLGLYAYLCFTSLVDWVIVLNTALVVVAWAITFFGAVPLHQALDQSGDHLSPAAKLLWVNGYRTVVWTVVWLITMVTTLSGAG